MIIAIVEIYIALSHSVFSPSPTEVIAALNLMFIQMIP